MEVHHAEPIGGRPGRDRTLICCALQQGNGPAFGRDCRYRGARSTGRAAGGSSRVASGALPRRATEHHPGTAAAQVPGAEPGRERLAIHARRLALQLRLHFLQRHRRLLLPRMEQARRSALENHVSRNARVGARILINDPSY